MMRVRSGWSAKSWRKKHFCFEGVVLVIHPQKALCRVLRCVALWDRYAIALITTEWVRKNSHSLPTFRPDPGCIHLSIACFYTVFTQVQHRSVCCIIFSLRMPTYLDSIPSHCVSLRGS